jgi:aminobenzoyl-glutamate utilization protein A
MALPPDERLDEWFERARERGADPDLLDRMEGGNTGVVAVLDRGEGPTVGLRVDIDGLFVEESRDADHVPVAEGFRSETEGTMHACGHDAHMTWGLGTLDRIRESEFAGRLVVFFQPAEEVAGGGRPMAESDYAADLDYLFAAHVGLDHPTGEVVAGIERPLAMCHVDVDIEGTSAHAGKAPQDGDNAVQALATAIDGVYGIPRHADGSTRVNVGRVNGGTASNVIADGANAVCEARGETTELMEYAREELRHRFEAAADLHGCTAEVDGVSEVLPAADFGASEDATYLMQRVQDAGGRATYLIVGTDHPTSHHTPTFDVDERSLATGVEVLVGSIRSVADGGGDG